MSASAHGHTVAAWTAVSICFIGFLVAGVAMVVPSPIGVVGGLVVAAIAPIIGKLMSAAGLGKKPNSTPVYTPAKKSPVETGASS